MKHTAPRTVIMDGKRLEHERVRLGVPISKVPDFIAKQVRGDSEVQGSWGGVSESTYRRARDGYPVFIRSAETIAKAFGVPLEDLLLSNYPSPLLSDVDHFLAEMRSIIQQWLEEGHDANEKGLPAHPEFIYRLSGDWKGWNHLLAVSPEQQEWEEHISRDRSEGCAFQIVEALVLVERARHEEPGAGSSGAD